MAFPSFYDPNSIDKVYLERAALVAEEAVAYAKRGRITPAAQDNFRIAAFGIDCQIGFCVPGASLFVPGAVEDTRRTVEWIYSNATDGGIFYYDVGLQDASFFDDLTDAMSKYSSSYVRNLNSQCL